MQNVRNNRNTPTTKSRDTQGTGIYSGRKSGETGQNQELMEQQPDIKAGISSNEGSGNKVDPQFEIISEKSKRRG